MLYRLAQPLNYTLYMSRVSGQIHYLQLRLLVLKELVRKSSKTPQFLQQIESVLALLTQLKLSLVTSLLLLIVVQEQLPDKNRQLILHFQHLELQSLQLILLVLVLLTHMTLKLVHQSDWSHVLALIRQLVSMLMLISVSLDYLTVSRLTEHTMSLLLVE